MATAPDGDALEVQLGHRVSERASKHLRDLCNELVDRKLDATQAAVLDVLIKRSTADELVPHFPAMPPKGQKRSQRAARGSG